jgi:ABC-2 type transport system permease protein
MIRPADTALLRRWIRARVRVMLRNPRASFFTFVFPLLFLVIFSALNGNTLVDAVGPAAGKVRFAQFYAPSIGIFGLTMACYTGVIMGLAMARDNGLLKRVRGTPLPMGIYIGSWLSGAVLTGIASVVLMFAVAVPAFGVHIYAHLLPAAIVTLVLGAISLSALGLAVSTLARTAEQAQPLAQLTFLPLSFISGVFYPLEGAPHWLVTLAGVFPLRHIVETFDACFVRGTPNAGWSGSDLLVIAAWAVGGFVVAARRFRWEPEAARRSPLRLGWLRP